MENQKQTTNVPAAVAVPVSETPGRGAVTYQVAGQDVRLSYQIVRDFLTKGGGNVSDQDLTQFISICKYNQLNPFLGEAYLVKYGQQPAQMVVSKEALMKRAEANEHYKGFQSGVIVMRGGEPVELEGGFFLPGDTLVGAWAKVFRDDREFPVVSRVRLEEYDKKQSTWNEKKSTMIRKVAMVQAMREAFPAQLGAMYTQEETAAVTEDVTYTEVSDKVEREIAEHANKETVSFEEQVADQGSATQETPAAPAGKKPIAEQRKMGF